MDFIKAKVITTIYDYDELSIVINNKSIDTILFEITGDEQLLGLYPAWGNGLLWKNESNLIWELIGQSKGTCNIPILLCPDDLDFSCTIIIAKVTKTGQGVVWENIGKVTNDNYSLEEELQSGILCTDKWSDEDWKKYAATLAWCKVESNEWLEWISANWDDEQWRRLQNYTKPYLQDDNNISWFNIPRMIFSCDNYNTCVDVFKKEIDIYEEKK